MSDLRSPSKDYTAMTDGRGYVVLEDWSTVTMTGADRHSFLHNMCTNEIKKLPIGHSCEAFCTDVKGKIVAHVLVTACEDRLELLAVPNQAETLINHLDRYIIREDVTLRDSSAQIAWLLVAAGKTSTDWMERAVAEHVVCKLDNGLPGVILGVAIQDLERTEQTLNEAGCIFCGYEAWETLRIEAGFPLFGIDFDSSRLPQEINRDELAINFNKGCYLGQETIARIDALGHVNQKIVSVKFESESLPSIGLELNAADKCVGRVTSRCWSPKFNSPLALAMVRRGANELGSELSSDSGTATVVSST